MGHAPEDGIPAAKVGRYELVRRIGKGGMAEVFLARRTGIEGFSHLCVVKTILPKFANDPDFVEMFFDEARITVELQHPNVVRVFDLDRADDLVYLAMEYVEGMDALTLMVECEERGITVPFAAVMYIFSETLKGLHFAHTATDTMGRPLGLVHRDISPGNILLGVNGSVKLSDFGVARATNAKRSEEPGMLVGKLRYFAPELLETGNFSPASDIFALGTCLYEMLAMEPLFPPARNAREQRKMVRDWQPEQVLERHLDFPDGMDEILLRALAKSPDHRYPSAMEFLEDVSDLAHESGIRLGDMAMVRFIEGIQAKIGQREEEEADGTSTRFRNETRAPGTADHPAQLGSVVGGELSSSALEELPPDALEPAYDPASPPPPSAPLAQPTPQPTPPPARPAPQAAPRQPTPPPARQPTPPPARQPTPSPARQPTPPPARQPTPPPRRSALADDTETAKYVPASDVTESGSYQSHKSGLVEAMSNPGSLASAPPTLSPTFEIKVAGQADLFTAEGRQGPYDAAQIRHITGHIPISGVELISIDGRPWEPLSGYRAHGGETGEIAARAFDLLQLGPMLLTWSRNGGAFETSLWADDHAYYLAVAQHQLVGISAHPRTAVRTAGAILAPAFRLPRGGHALAVPSPGLQLREGAPTLVSALIEAVYRAFPRAQLRQLANARGQFLVSLDPDAIKGTGDVMSTLRTIPDPLQKGAVLVRDLDDDDAGAAMVLVILGLARAVAPGTPAPR